MDLVMKAAAVGAVAALVGLAIRKANPEMSLLLAMVSAAVVVGMGLTMVSGIRDTLRMAMEYTGLKRTMVLPVLKCVGVGIVARFGADICRDAGQSGTASAVEICGAAAALGISLPLVNTLLHLLGTLI